MRRMMLIVTLSGFVFSFAFVHMSQNRSVSASSQPGSIAPTTNAIVEATRTHCERNEQVIFSCIMQKSTKILSICASKQLDGKNGYVQYRFGKPGNIELAFPGERMASQEQFGYNRYTRPLVTYLTLSFESNGYKYSIHQDSNEEEKPRVNAAYLNVTPPEPEARPIEMTCRQPTRGNLMLLEDVVPRTE